MEKGVAGKLHHLSVSIEPDVPHIGHARIAVIAVIDSLGRCKDYGLCLSLYERRSRLDCIRLVAAR